MSGERDDDADRARRILRRLAGSTDEIEGPGASLDDPELADRLQQIEQLFHLHGGERPVGGEGTQRPAMFEWGHLQVIEPLGQGSFGDVYRAYDQTLDREVALKLLRVDQDRPFQSQLFLHEARQLALVRHRNVLAVHGAAVHEHQPGLWTDLIEGTTLNDPERRERRYALDETLDMVESLALALQAVHRAGLVHGDVKPANIMQDRSGDWILMDFGASLERRRAEEGPAMTSGTPLYMAPEVVLGDPPSAASDLYSLGATLYRALSGYLPIEAEDWSALEAAHRAGRRPDPALARGRVDGRIIRLIDRLVAPEPQERPRLGKVLREVRAIREAPQRRFRTMALSSIAGLLVVGLTLTSIGFFRANDARIEAQREQRNAEAVNQFLQRALASPSSTGRARDLTVEDMLLKAAADVKPSLSGQPAAQVLVHRVLAESFNTLRLPERSLEQIALGRQALATLDRPLPEIERGFTLQEAFAAELQDRHEDSIAIVEAFLDRHLAELGEDDWQIRWARMYQITNRFPLGRLDEAEALLDAHFSDVPAPETAERHFGYEILQSRGHLYRMQARYDEAVVAAVEALDWLDRFSEPRPNNRASALTNLALNQTYAGQPEAAISTFEALLPLQARIFGEGSQEYVGTLINLAGAQRESGAVDASGETLMRARELIDAYPDAGSAEKAFAVAANLANVLNATGEHARAETIMRDSLAMAIDEWGDDSLNVLKLEYNLAELLNQQGRHEEARSMATVTLEKKARTLGENHAFTLLTMDNLAIALGGLGEGEDALALHDQAFAAAVDQLGSGHPFSLLIERHRVAAQQQFAPDAVQPGLLADLVSRHEKALGADHPETQQARLLLEP